MKQFDLAYIETEFARVAPLLARPVTIHVIGGGSMAFRGTKRSTKDIDVVLQTEDEAHALTLALRKAGYGVPGSLATAYRAMAAHAILDDPGGFRWDVFVVDVIGFEFSDRMRRRSSEWRKTGNLTVMAAAPEDVFLMKAVTERDRDLEDMAALYQAGLDRMAVLDEFREQAEAPGERRFAAFIYQRIREFVEQTALEFPELAEMEGLATREMLAELVLRELRQGPRMLDEIRQKVEASAGELDGALARLHRQGLVESDGGRLSLKTGPPRPNVR